MFQCQKCYLCKTNVVLDSGNTGKIKRALAENNTIDINDNSKKSKASVNLASIIDSLPSDRVNEPNNTNDKMYDAVIPVTMLKLLYDSVMD